MTRAVAALSVLALAPGCAQIEALWGQTKAPIVYVDIVERPQDGGEPVDKAPLEAAMRDVMRDWDAFAFRNADPDETGWQVDLRIGLATERTADEGEGMKRRAAKVALRLHALGDVEREPDELRVEALVSRDEPASKPRAAVVADAVREAGRRLQVSMDLHWGDEAAVMAALDSDEEWRRREAIEVAGVRQLRPAVPKLMAMVRDTETLPDIATQAVGALVDIGAPEAAGAIIDACRRKSPTFVVSMVYALGQLGGREAEAYLFTVSQGHPHPEVKAAAERALEELDGRRRRRAKDPAAPAQPAAP